MEEFGNDFSFSSSRSEALWEREKRSFRNFSFSLGPACRVGAMHGQREGGISLCRHLNSNSVGGTFVPLRQIETLSHTSSWKRGGKGEGKVQLSGKLGAVIRVAR